MSDVPPDEGAGQPVPEPVMSGDPLPAVMIPKQAAHYAAQRHGLAEIPIGSVAGNTQESRDEIMREAEELAAATAKNQENDNNDDDDEAMDADDDLFGDAADAEVEETAAEEAVHAQTQEESAEPRAGTAELSEAEMERRRRLEYEEEGEPKDGAVMQQETTFAAVTFANLPMASDTEKLWHARLPNFLHLESGSYSPSTYNPSNEPTSVPVENTIRWRWHPQRPMERQSNARMIRWSDGSMSMQVGDELFDVATDRAVNSGKSVAPAGPGAVANGGQHAADATTFLVAQHAYVGLLESQAAVTGNMTFRLTSLASQSHRKLASALSAKTAASGKSKTVMVMAGEGEGQKPAAGRKATRRKGIKREGGAASARGRKAGRRSVRSTRLDDFSDEDDFEDSAGLAGDDADGMDSRAAAAERKKARLREQADMDGFIASEDSDEDEDADSDEGGGRSSRRKDRAAREEEEAEDDDLDALEAQAQRAAKADRVRKKGKTGSGTSASGPTPQRAPPKEIDSDDLDADDAEVFTRKKLVVESDED